MNAQQSLREHNGKRKKFLMHSAVVFAFICAALVFSVYVSKLDTIESFLNDYGYFGIFTLSLFSGINILVPVPAISFAPALVEAGLNFWLIIFWAAVGMAIGDIAWYALGKAGRHMVRTTRMEKYILRFERLRMRNEVLPLIALAIAIAFIPIPNEVLLIPVALLGYSTRFVVPFIFAGAVLFNFLAASGLVGIFNLFTS